MKTQHYLFKSKIILYLIIIFTAITSYAEESVNSSSSGSISVISKGLTSTSNSSGIKSDLNTGAARFKIDIDAPKVRAGNIKPLININYNSDRRNGYLGVGWDMATYYIERKNNMLTDKTEYVLHMGDNAINLVSIGNRKYRAAVAEFYMIAYEPRTETSSFRVKDGAGNAFYFSKLHITGLKVNRWYLITQVDTNNNRINYTYEDPSIIDDYIDAPRLKSISYNNNYTKIEFESESRDDVYTYAKGGIINRVNQRLKNVKILFNDNLVKKYVFSYNYSKSTNRSLLESVAAHGKDGVLDMPLTEFKYTESGQNIEENILPYLETDDIVLDLAETSNNVLDLNGDAYIDITSIINLYENGNDNIANVNYNIDGRLHRSDERYLEPDYSVNYDINGATYIFQRVNLVDLDNDKIPDYTWNAINYSTGMRCVAYLGKERNELTYVSKDYCNKTLGLKEYSELSGAELPNKITHFVDINNDGFKDIVVAEVVKDGDSYKRVASIKLKNSILHSENSNDDILIEFEDEEIIYTLHHLNFQSALISNYKYLHFF